MFDKIVKGLFGTEKKEEIPVEKEEEYETFNMDNEDEDDELLIAQILGDAETETECLDAWQHYLTEKLIFPFSADYCSAFGGPISDDATVNVLKMNDFDEEYGIMVTLKYENELHIVPLYDLVVEDEHADNYDALEIYGVWFDNKE